MRIIITGASGIIGRVLMGCLAKKHEVIGVDKKSGVGVMQLDILKELEKFQQILQPQDIIIHLAWDTKEHTTPMRPIIDDNKKMGELVFELALQKKVKLVIFASSVHASMGHLLEFGYPDFNKKHQAFHNKKKIKVADGFFPLGAYGASKVYLEALGKAYSAKGLAVIAVRFGNVTPDNGYGEYPFWLSYRDCCQFIEKCCIVKGLPQFLTLFAMSDNICNPFDISEARKILDYNPQDSSLCPLIKKERR
jgi:nucleoside-diphosphate-sugar epimerase